jgi:hypothetical protein
MSVLDNLQVATPCPMKWSQMRGDDRVRMCGRCRLHVYNLSAMTTPEATSLLEEKGGKVCATFVRRADGTVITQDCRGGFSERFWEKFGTVERKGMFFLVGGAFTALFFAAVVTLFGDNVRALFGQSTTGALAGDTVVEKRVNKLPKKPFAHDQPYQGY